MSEAARKPSILALINESTQKAIEQKRDAVRSVRPADDLRIAVAVAAIAIDLAESAGANPRAVAHLREIVLDLGEPARVAARSTPARST